MSRGERWIRRPQSVWLRKALFQIHLWTGIGVGIYVVLISVSGSAIVFRNEITKSVGTPSRVVAVSGQKLGEAQLKEAAQRAYPKLSVTEMWDGARADEATEIWLGGDGNTKMRLFDPYTGRDLGDSVPYLMQVLTFLIDFHTDLSFGRTGRTLNGVGAILTTLLVLSGAVIWWPGIENWRGSLLVEWRTNWKRLNWNLHSVVGIWTLAFAILWGVTGIYVVFPTPVQKAVNFFSPLRIYSFDVGSQATPAKTANSTPANAQSGSVPGRRGRVRIKPSPGDQFLRWLYYLHFGDFAGWRVKTIWVLFGLAPPFLFITGALMWWNRVLSKVVERRPVAELRPSEARSTD